MEKNRNREWLDDKVFRMIAWSIVTTIAAELAFASYISVNGFSKLLLYKRYEISYGED